MVVVSRHGSCEVNAKKKKGCVAKKVDFIWYPGMVGYKASHNFPAELELELIPSFPCLHLSPTHSDRPCMHAQRKLSSLLSIYTSSRNAATYVHRYLLAKHISTARKASKQAFLCSEKTLPIDGPAGGLSSRNGGVQIVRICCQ